MAPPTIISLFLLAGASAAVVPPHPANDAADKHEAHVIPGEEHHARRLNATLNGGERRR